MYLMYLGMLLLIPISDISFTFSFVPYHVLYTGNLQNMKSNLDTKSLTCRHDNLFQIFLNIFRYVRMLWGTPGYWWVLTSYRCGGGK